MNPEIELMNPPQVLSIFWDLSCARMKSQRQGEQPDISIERATDMKAMKSDSELKLEQMCVAKQLADVQRLCRL